LQNRRELFSVKLAAAHPNRSIERIAGSDQSDVVGAERCFSVLVETGVYSPEDEADHQVILSKSKKAERQNVEIQILDFKMSTSLISLT
jgi:hypothetical protein